jgi:hypothetical protein
MSDGVSVYKCTSPDEVVDLVQGGQGVFGIALGGVWKEVEGTLADLPAERAHVDDLDEADGAGGADHAAGAGGRPSDELARRRSVKKTG